MSAITLTLIALAIAAVAAALAPLFLTWRRTRGERLITCPENHAPAAVKVDAIDAAFHSFVGIQELHLKSCTRWPEMEGCGQECLAQIDTAPDGCLVASLLASWYKGKDCAVCGKSFGKIEAWDPKPALMSPDRVTMEWPEVPAVELPEKMATHLPVCWDCHIIESLYRRHPELVTERPAHWAHYH